ncbi:MAG TPA: nucleotidyltransferase family protein [Anaerolineaceae bacterium]
MMMEESREIRQDDAQSISISDCERIARELIAATEKSESERNITREGEPDLAPEQQAVYRELLIALNNSGARYVIAAAFARNAYTRIWRPTKDLDVFLPPADLKLAFNALREAGFRVEVVQNHWLAKAWKGTYFIDLIFGTGHNQVQVDDEMLAASQPIELWGVPTRLIAVEDMVAAACFIKGRKRNDLPDTLHLILAVEGNLDWDYILRRLGDNYPLLLVDLILFGYVYPGHVEFLPQGVVRQFFERMLDTWSINNHLPHEFRGTLIDPFSYTVDVRDWGYEDKRKAQPLVNKHGELL